MKLRNKKTGKVFDAIIREKGGGNTYSIIVCNIEEYSKPPLARCILGEYDSLAELNEEWEDYKPTEPLIKDEKIRKVVRAWLESNDLDGATFHTSSHFFHYCTLRGFNDNGQGVDIDFFLTWEGIPNLIDGKYYTKFELCGEEEE